MLLGSSRRPPSCPKSRFQGRAQGGWQAPRGTCQSAEILTCPCRPGGFKVPRHALPVQHSGREAFPRLGMAGHYGPSRWLQPQVDRTPLPTAQRLLLLHCLKPQPPGPSLHYEPVSPPLGRKLHVLTRKRHSPWNYMQMSSAYAATRPPGRRCLGKLGAGFQQGRLCD